MHVSNMKETYINGKCIVSVRLDGRKQEFVSYSSMDAAHNLMGKRIAGGFFFSDESESDDCDDPNEQSDDEMREEAAFSMECQR